MADNKIQIVGTNIAEKATMIWNVADMLRGPFKPHEYGLVILPMTVVKSRILAELKNSSNSNRSTFRIRLSRRLIFLRTRN